MGRGISIMVSKASTILLGTTVLALTAMSATASSQPAASSADQATPPPMVFPAWGFNMSDLDKSVKPGDDFNAFANGKWIAATTIPPKYSDYGVSRNLVIGAEQAVREILADTLKANGAPGTLE